MCASLPHLRPHVGEADAVALGDDGHGKQRRRNGISAECMPTATVIVSRSGSSRSCACLVSWSLEGIDFGANDPLTKLGRLLTPDNPIGYDKSPARRRNTSALAKPITRIPSEVVSIELRW